MGPGWALGLGLLLETLGGAAGGSHSLRYFLTGVTHPSPGLPRFVSVGTVDGQLINHYDSEGRRMEPRAEWVRAAVDPEFWDRNTRISQGCEQNFHMNLDTLRERYQQSGRSHTLQSVFGCDLLEDGAIRGLYQH
ncbi:HA1F protein, partial [Penelope pileata]|nr:HA1F protein [Penelope pileata]